MKSKKIKGLIPCFTVLFLGLLMGFGWEDENYNEYKPIFMQRVEMEKNIVVDEPRLISNPGKIYLKDNYILINEKYKGIHVVDNSYPEHPSNIAFIRVDGCIDMAVKDNVLYADNAVDLIAIKYNPAFAEIEVTKRIKNVFPELIAPDGRSLSWKERQAIPENSVLVRWEKRY